MSDWTLDSLKALLDERHQCITFLLKERDHRLKERWEAQQKELTQFRVDILRSETKANEWRGALDDQREQLVTREEWAAGHNSLSAKVDAHRDALMVRMTGMDEARQSIRERVTALEASIGAKEGRVTIAVLMAIVSLAVNVLLGTWQFFVHHS